MTSERIRRAIFFDRDGVLNDVDVDWSIPKSFAPRDPEKLTLFPEAVDVLLSLKSLGEMIIVVSNQPDIALGKVDEAIKDKLQQTFLSRLQEKGINIDVIYYCHHHPNSNNPQYPKECTCRKPKPGMLLKAAEEHGIDLQNSWMIGDTWSDIEAGNAAGCKTILLKRPWSQEEKCNPNHIVENLQNALDIIRQSPTIPTAA